MPCFLCQSLKADMPPPLTRTHIVSCPDCGKYQLTLEAGLHLQSQSNRALELAFWVAQQNLFGNEPKITSETISHVLSLGLPSVKKRSELLLGYLISESKGKIRAEINFADRRLQMVSCCTSAQDVVDLCQYLIEQGALERAPFGPQISLIAKGHIIYDEMIGVRVASSQVFVAMWFDSSMNDVYSSGIEPAVLNAGYAPIRIDKTEHDGKIDDRIIAEIRRSSFLIADFTGHRGGVYYEAGFAHGLGRRVIFMCQKDHLDKLHFDIRQYNTIVWDTPDDIVKLLQNRILAIHGAGPLKVDAKPIA
ncbi:hypothetical protein [Nitrospirillum sp. BR 11828]|uniref:hypothetical protein n=1 Tax=Nitrospirillum sp. BR 11828 TaxID=3104325 RepID=UPI002ACAB0EE|nr:hypothetical protein [Nitrospirillum sp. BR 11828]MDZ5648618.1 hypothetical protein [Nitrospirillum sp. BR 11828]